MIYNTTAILTILRFGVITDSIEQLDTFKNYPCVNEASITKE